MTKTSVKRKRKITLPTAIQGNKKVKVGWPKGEVSDEVIDRAIYNHFGTETIPERPALSNAIRDNQPNYKDAMRKSAKSVMRGDVSPAVVMSKLGILAQGDIQAEIVNLREPANAPSTVRQKKSSNPLIDTGEMKNEVTYQTYD